MTPSSTQTFRARTLEEVLPKIKAELGPDAVIVRQRDGLTGGVGGFFQRQCIEVDAHPGEPAEQSPAQPRFDAYDDEPAMPEPFVGSDEGTPDVQAYRRRSEAIQQFVPDPVAEPDEPTAEGLTAPGIQEILRQAAPFADHLSAASTRPPRYAEPEPEPEPDPQPALERPLTAPRGRPATADAIEQALVGAGLEAERAGRLVAETVSHALPFGSPRRLRRLVRDALARQIPIASIAAPGGRSLAFAGPGGSGKTLCTARIAAAYAAASDLPVVCLTLRPADGGAELAALLEPHGVGVTAVGSADEARAHVAGALRHALVVVDTPAVSPRSESEVAALGRELDALGLDEVHLTLPATYSGRSAEELSERLAPLHATRLTLTHMDETMHVGGLVDYLIRSGQPAAYTSEGSSVPGGLNPADAGDLAGLVLP